MVTVAVATATAAVASTIFDLIGERITMTDEQSNAYRPTSWLCNAFKSLTNYRKSVYRDENVCAWERKRERKRKRQKKNEYNYRTWLSTVKYIFWHVI